MSEPPINPDPPMQPLPDQRKGCLQVFAVLIGGAMLLPGICAGFFVVVSFQQPHDPYLSGWLPLWLACFAISLAGIGLIVWAVRRLRQ